MRLPGGTKAFVDIAKLCEYVLNPLHPRGKHKARVFASALQIHQAEAELLQQKLTEAAATGDAIISECDEHGQRYILDFECIREGQRAVVRSGWIVLTGEDFPRLTTCYVLSK